MDVRYGVCTSRRWEVSVHRVCTSRQLWPSWILLVLGGGQAKVRKLTAKISPGVPGERSRADGSCSALWEVPYADSQDYPWLIRRVVQGKYIPTLWFL